ncbi:hypothetical protein JCM11251_005642 [Rhodosporidiobolus azoricus]
MSHLDPLPSDLLALSSKAYEAHSLNLSNVDEIIARLELARSQLASSSGGVTDQGQPEAGGRFADTLLPLSSFVKTANSKAQAAHKEWGSAVNRLGKDVDKKFGAPPPPLFPPPPAPPTTKSTLQPSLAALLPPSTSLAPAADSAPATGTGPFSSPTSLAALNLSIAAHLARLGAFSSLSCFLAESSTPSPPGLEEGGETLSALRALHGILEELREGKVQRAVEWVEKHPNADDNSELEYALRKEEFIRLLLSERTAAGESVSNDAMDMDEGPASAAPATLAAAFAARSVDPLTTRALAYGGTHFRRLLTPQRSEEICALLTSPLYLPLPRLLSSAYGSIYTPYLPPCPSSPYSPPAPTQALLAAFSAAYLATLSLPRDSPLSVVTDVGGSGALAKIMKVRQVMKEKKTEWTAVGELPVEIPLPLRYRYHSVFACPVSKEQSTEANPPMLLPCGHVIARESLARLARGTPTLKCPYCPVVSHFSACVRVHF